MTQQTMPTCYKCGAKNMLIYQLCDEETRKDRPYCPACFEKHPCGLGEHGEGCATLVHYDDRTL